MNSKFKCTGCKEYYPSEQKLEINRCSFHDFDCAVDYGNRKAKKIMDRQRATKHKALKKKVSDDDKSGWTKKAQAAFNKFIRLRDFNDPCISCLRVHSGQYHAGHYRTVGASPELRFNEHNCNKQCAPCNNHLSGNIINYRINLINKISLASIIYLEGPHNLRRYTVAELKTIIKWYKRKIKRLEKCT